MTRFNVEYRGKISVVRAETAIDAIRQFANRQYFGKKRIHTYRISIVDAETYGERECRAVTDEGYVVLAVMI